jgi:hypothetical protein
MMVAGHSLNRRGGGMTLLVLCDRRASLGISYKGHSAFTVATHRCRSRSG